MSSEGGSPPRAGVAVLDVGDELEHPRVELLGALTAERMAPLRPLLPPRRQQGAGTVVRLARTKRAAAAADHHEGGDAQTAELRVGGASRWRNGAGEPGGDGGGHPAAGVLEGRPADDPAEHPVPQGIRGGG